MPMKDSAALRRYNTGQIRRVLWQGGEYTKQQLAAATGLSVATCNTLLNALEQSGEVLGRKRQMQGVGRQSVCYRINEEHEAFLAVYFDRLQGQDVLTLALLTALGRVVWRKRTAYHALTAGQIGGELEALCREHPVTQIVAGTPSIAENGVIRHCDIPTLENAAVVQEWQQRCGCPVHLENDMHLRAYGYYKTCGDARAVVTLANFAAHVLPGTATVSGGAVLRGQNQFAGMVGFLPYDMPRAQQLALLAPGTCRPLVARAVTSVIALLNPGTVVLTGDLLNAGSIDALREDCLQTIPPEYMPKLVYCTDMTEYYLAGLYHRALDRKGEAYD